MKQSLAELKKATHPIYLATTFDGAINGNYIRPAGTLEKVTEKGFKKFNERFFAIPSTPEVHSVLQPHHEAGTITEAVMIQILALPDAPDKTVMIIAPDEGFAYLSDSRIPKGEYFGQCTEG